MEKQLLEEWPSEKDVKESHHILLGRLKVQIRPFANDLDLLQISNAAATLRTKLDVLNTSGVQSNHQSGYGIKRDVVG